MSHQESLFLSEDGSHTIFSPKYGAHYHSRHGALDESIHVFIIAGLYKLIRQSYSKIRIFEMGFGSGLNALLTLLESEKFNIDVSYDTIESDPVPLSEIEKLNYSELLSCSSTILNELHKASQNQYLTFQKGFHFRKHIGKIEDHVFDKKFDLVYWDAFAPECQAFLWEREIHKRIYDALDDYGVLVTYCTKGSFKRVLKGLGYKLESLMGPGKKREMIRAVKCLK